MWKRELRPNAFLLHFPSSEEKFALRSNTAGVCRWKQALSAHRAHLISEVSQHEPGVTEEVKAASVKCSLQDFPQHSNCSYNCC
ncbi:serine/threonine-protein kinase N3 [Sarotherodon galilaeus]